MSSGSPDPRPAPAGSPWTLGLRLLLAYAALFAASTVLLFVLAYALFVYFSREPDRAYLKAQARALGAVYARAGLDGLRAELGADGDRRREELLVRLAGPDGRTLLLYNPDDWKRRELEELARQPVPEDEAWLPLGPAEDEDALQAFSLRLPGGAVIQAGMDSDVREDALASMRDVFVAIALPVLVLALLGGALLAYRALRPVRSLLRTLQAITATGDVERRVPTDDARGEFAALARLFNEMLDRIQLLLTGMRSTLDDVAHDLRTPMTHLRGTAELALQREDDPAACREALADSLEVSERMLTLLDTLMTVSEVEAGTMPLRREPLPLAPLVTDVADLYRFVAEEKGVALDVDVEAGGTVPGDAGRLGQALANLLDNAIKYTPAGGHVAVRARRREDRWEVVVQDDGTGIAPDDLPHIWNRLYRGDRSRSERGLGLGLSLVKAIVEAHGGRVSVQSTPGQGSTFTVDLPAAP